MDKDAVFDEGSQAVSSVGGVIADEIGKIIKSVIGQTTGNSTSDSSSSNSQGTDNYEALAKKDEEFSKKAEAQLQAKIQAMYAGYAARSKQEAARLAEKHKEEEVEEAKLEELNASRVRQGFVNRAIEQTRPENKNFGAE